MMTKAYQFKNLLQYKDIVHGISSKAFMSMKRLDTKQVDRSALLNFEKTLNIFDSVITMKQIHSGNVAVIEKLDKTQIPDTDGMITDKHYFPLAVLTADCLPLLFYDPKQNAIAVAHAGYKGLLHHVIEHTIKRMHSEFDSNPKDIIVGIGPSIERDCYEVGKELIDQFKEAFPKFKNIYTETEGNYHLDLRAVAQQCLLKEGILKEHIEVMDICTKCDPNFYSYRGGDGDHRFASIICLRVP